MTVRVFERTQNKTNWISRFLANHHVQHQMVASEELGAMSRRNFQAAVEVDGHLLIDPNEDALKKILHVD